MIKIRLHGRGGQGAVVASKILAGAYYGQGFQVQAFPAFGMERRGAPVSAFVRADRDKIRERGEILDPDAAIVLDPALLDMIDVTQGLVAGATILLNHPGRPEGAAWEGFKVAAVDASKIALKHGIGSRLAPIVNTVILGAFARLDPGPDLDHVLAAIKSGAPTKPEANAAAAQEAFDSVRTG